MTRLANRSTLTLLPAGMGTSDTACHLSPITKTCPPSCLMSLRATPMSQNIPDAPVVTLEKWDLITRRSKNIKIRLKGMVTNRASSRLIRNSG